MVIRFYCIQKISQEEDCPFKGFVKWTPFTRGNWSITYNFGWKRSFSPPCMELFMHQNATKWCRRRYWVKSSNKLFIILVHMTNVPLSFKLSNELTKVLYYNILEQVLNLGIKLRIHNTMHNKWWTTVNLKWIVDFTWKATLTLILKCYVNEDKTPQIWTQKKIKQA
jgi:hypothetical protein